MGRLITSLGNRPKSRQPLWRWPSIWPFGKVADSERPTESTATNRPRPMRLLCYLAGMAVTVMAYWFVGTTSMLRTAEYHPNSVGNMAIAVVLTLAFGVLCTLLALRKKRPWVLLAARWLAWLYAMALLGWLAACVRMLLHQQPVHYSNPSLVGVLFLTPGLIIMTLVLPSRHHIAYLRSLVVVGVVMFILIDLIFLHIFNLSTATGVITAVIRCALVTLLAVAMCDDYAKAWTMRAWLVRRVAMLSVSMALFLLLSTAILA